MWSTHTFHQLLILSVISGRKIVILVLSLILASITSSLAQGSWTRKADFGGIARGGAVSFTINGKAYIGTGSASLGTEEKDFWEYDPLLDTWKRKADFAGVARRWAVGFNIEEKGYLGTGGENSLQQTDQLKDFWEYNPKRDKWIRKADFGGAPRQGAIGFSIGSKGYLT